MRARLDIQLRTDEDKSPHVCSAAGTNVSTVYMLRRDTEDKNREKERDWFATSFVL